ncbi:GNAT family N-acetyltransferase, partial [Nocardia sp.]|uniref:GNAT family N-acetyltransferase n=1 Tax=Nocardia sp. TaxID=1821 RepID=UPI002586FD0A
GRGHDDRGVSRRQDLDRRRTRADMNGLRLAVSWLTVLPVRIGYFEGRPEFLFELYNPLRSDLARPGTGYSHEAGDIGMHLLVASSERSLPGFTANVMLHIMRTAFLEFGAARVVVEPDVRNLDVQRLNAAVGFEVEGDYPVADKMARLSYCTRADFLRVTDDGRSLANADQLIPLDKAAL